MFWLLIGLGCFGLLVLMMALCKAAGDADRRIEEMAGERICVSVEIPKDVCEELSCDSEALKKFKEHVEQRFNEEVEKWLEKEIQRLERELLYGSSEINHPKGLFKETKR